MAGKTDREGGNSRVWDREKITVPGSGVSVLEYQFESGTKMKCRALHLAAGVMPHCMLVATEMMWFYPGTAKQCLFVFSCSSTL